MEVIRENIEIVLNSLDIDADDIYASGQELFIETRSYIENEDLVFALLEEEMPEIKHVTYDQDMFIVYFENDLIPEVL